jgi:hypothetical protein
VRRTVIIIAAAVLLAIVGLALSRENRTNLPPPAITVRFLGYTNTPAGDAFARFEFTNSSPIRVSIGSRVPNAGTRIPPFGPTSVGGSATLIVEMPATNFLGGSSPVLFECMRWPTSQEKLLSKAYVWAEAIGVDVSKLRFRSMTNRTFSVICPL